MSDLGLACDLRMVVEQTWPPLAQPDTLHEALAAYELVCDWQGD